MRSDIPMVLKDINQFGGKNMREKNYQAQQIGNTGHISTRRHLQ